MGVFKLGQRLVMRLVAREADIPELALVKIGKGPQRLSAFPPSLERRVQNQQAVDGQQDEVIVPQGTDWGKLEAFVLGECARRVFEQY